MTFRIVYPGGDRTKLTVSEVENDEELQYFDLASRVKFNREIDALKYGKELAVRHNLYFVESKTAYLD